MYAKTYWMGMMDTHIQTIQVELPCSKHEASKFTCWLHRLAAKIAAESDPRHDAEDILFLKNLDAIADQIDSQL